MCLILDANEYHNFLNSKNDDMQLVRNWVENDGKMAYSLTQKFKQELNNYLPMKDRMDEYRQSGRLKLHDPVEVDEEQRKLPTLRSDDPHIIALAILARVKLLITNDQALIKDFKNPKIVGGKCYSTISAISKKRLKSLKNLLANSRCP